MKRLEEILNNYKGIKCEVKYCETKKSFFESEVNKISTVLILKIAIENDNIGETEFTILRRLFETLKKYNAVCTFDAKQCFVKLDSYISFIDGRVYKIAKKAFTIEIDKDNVEHFIKDMEDENTGND